MEFHTFNSHDREMMYQAIMGDAHIHVWLLRRCRIDFANGKAGDALGWLCSNGSMQSYVIARGMFQSAGLDGKRLADNFEAYVWFLQQTNPTQAEWVMLDYYAYSLARYVSSSRMDSRQFRCPLIKGPRRKQVNDHGL